MILSLQGDWSRFAYPVQRSYGISVDEWSDQPLVPAFFGHSKGPSLEPQPQYYTICCTVVAIWNYFWSFTIGSVASEPSSEQGRRKPFWNNLFTWSPTTSSPTVIYWLDFAETSPMIWLLVYSSFWCRFWTRWPFWSTSIIRRMHR